MTLEEIKTKICDLRCSVEELQEESNNLWKETEDKHVESLAEFLETELGYIAYRLSELEDMETETEETEDEDVQEWWDDLGNDDKASLVGIPAPSRNDARGDEQCEFDDFCNKWWNAKTISQKKKISLMIDHM
jgi:predicted nuclease with TOPRIM domain